MTDKKLKLRDSTLLAQEFVVVGESPDPQEIFIDHPALAKPLQEGLLLFTLYFGGKQAENIPASSQGQRSLVV